MSYTVHISQNFPKHKSWTFGPYETPELAAKDAEKHCILIGSKIVGSNDFEFKYENKFLYVGFVYVAKGTSFDGIDGFEISINKLDKNLGIDKQERFDRTLQCFGLVDRLADIRQKRVEARKRFLETKEDYK